MRLLYLTKDGNIRLTDNIMQRIPSYAIMSHTWGEADEEVTFQDIQDNPEPPKLKAGYGKINFCAEQADRDGLEYFWIDTCCIDKSNDVEFDEAINSMFHWYRNAAKCYVYLADVSISDQDDIDQAFQKSRWFTRGWTLQELIAPAAVEFFSSDGERLGDKKLLEQQLLNITGIPLTALRGGPLDSFSVQQRMAWAEKRKTTKEEDEAYSLLGIFNVFMPPMYGEGREYAFDRLNNEIRKSAKTSGNNTLSEGLPILRSDSVFLQERLLVRADVQAFLTEAFSCNGHVRAILHGLPGIGKSTMARFFAYNAQKTTAILWVPGDSEAAIKQAFERYAGQICGNDQRYSEPMPLIARHLSERFSGQCLVVLDGLDAPLINIQQYLFAGLKEGKVLITTRNRDLASYVGATRVLQMNPLSEEIGQDLLNMYMNTDSVSLSVGRPVQDEQTPQETCARRRIVRELGGLPLAIAIVGSALRKDSGTQSVDSQAYLSWTEEGKDVLLENEPEYSDYSLSVWRAFQFAFHGILQGCWINRLAAFMAHFVASCENASNVAEYVRFYRKFRQSDTQSAASSGRAVIDELRFLEFGLFDLALKALVAVNMVTVNWVESGSNDVPYIEMHSLVREWLVSTNYDKVIAYAGSKLWLLGLAMYERLNESRVGTSRFEPLLKEVSETLVESPRALDDSQVPDWEAVLPLLLHAQTKLSETIIFMPAGSAQRSRMHQLERELEYQITKSYERRLRGIDWNAAFQSWARGFEKLLEYIVKTNIGHYMFQNTFLCPPGVPGCILIIDDEVLHSLRFVGRTHTIETIKADITAKTKSLLMEYLAPEAFTQLPAIAPNEPGAFVLLWNDRWGRDLTRILRRSLQEVFVKVQSIGDTQCLATEVFSPSSGAVMVGEQIVGGYLQSVTSSSNSRNAFFAVLRRSVEAATKNFLDSCSAAELLSGQKVTLRDTCERSVRKRFGDRAADALRSPSFPAEAGMLWDLSWHEYFKDNLGEMIAEKTFNGISADLENAARQGLRGAFENRGYEGFPLVEELIDEFFSELAISNMFPDWELAGSISDDEDSDNGKPTYISFTHESTQQIMSAMNSTYYDCDNIANESKTFQAMDSTFHFREAIHFEVIKRLLSSEVLVETALGPRAAMLGFKKCDQSLRLVYSLLPRFVPRDLKASLDYLIRVEHAWESHYCHGVHGLCRPLICRRE